MVGDDDNEQDWGQGFQKGYKNPRSRKPMNSEDDEVKTHILNLSEMKTKGMSENRSFQIWHSFPKMKAEDQVK